MLDVFIHRRSDISLIVNRLATQYFSVLCVRRESEDAGMAPSKAVL